MKKIIPLLSLSNICSAYEIYSSKSFNFMICRGSNRPVTFMQFCYIDPSIQTVKTAFNDTFTFDLDSSNAKIQGSLSDLINVNNIAALVNNGLTPYLTFDYNWNGTQDCWIGGVYNTSVYVYINGVKTQSPLLPNPSNGYTKFREPLLNWKSQTDKTNNKVNLSNNFRIINEKGTTQYFGKDSQPKFLPHPSPLRQPPQCQFNVTNVHIEFDRSSMSDSLTKLKNQYFILNRLVIKELMLNSALLNLQINNKQLIVKALDMAKNIEGETTSNLSLAAQEYLSFLVSMAAENNAFNLNGVDPFTWLVNNEEKLRQEVKLIEEKNYFPHKESFMQDGKIINHLGYENAVHFASDYEQLMTTIKLGWTFANLTGDPLTVAKSPEHSWLYQVPLN